MKPNTETQSQKPRLKNPNDWIEKPVNPGYVCSVHHSLIDGGTFKACGKALKNEPYMFEHKEHQSFVLCPTCFVTLSALRNAESIQTVVAEQDLFRIPARFDSMADAGRFLMARDLDERKTVSLNRAIPGHPYDVAYQLAHVIREQFGFTDLRSTFGFMGMATPPTFTTVQTSETETAEVYIGQFSIPGMADSVVNTRPNSQMTELNISIECQSRHRSIAQSILTRTAERVVSDSLYSGKALSVRLGVDPRGNQYLEPPKFLPLPKDEPRVFLDSETTAKVATLQTLIEKTDLCRELGISTKHGALFHGVYGTGKTLTSQRLAWHAVRNGWTYVYVKDTAALAFVMPFISLYPNVVLFAEDIERTSGDTELQNILDGVQSKSAKNLILILTTNHKEEVPLPLRRPGRFDSVIEFRLPNADVAGRLSELFAGRYCGFTATDVGHTLAGLSPAMIRAIVDGAKIVAMERFTTTDGFKITAADISVSRSIYDDHIAYCSDSKPERKSGYEIIGDAIGKQVASTALLLGGNYLEGLAKEPKEMFTPERFTINAEKCETELAEVKG